MAVKFLFVYIMIGIYIIDVALHIYAANHSWPENETIILISKPSRFILFFPFDLSINFYGKLLS